MSEALKRLLRPLLSRAIRPRRIVAGPLRGVWLVTSWHDYPAGLLGRTERPLLGWFARHVRPGDTWIDVGAHYGYTAFALARLVGPAGRVFTFEPVPATAGCVDQGRALNRLHQLTVVPFGLGTPASFELRRLPLTRGMADATVSSPAARGFVNVPMARFDWLWPLLHGTDGTIHGIKIDVQGMEIETLGGMREALQRWRPWVVVELHAGVDRERLLTVLRDTGYSTAPSAIEPAPGEREQPLLDDRSYAFHPA